MAASGRLGRKSGRGYYDYAPGATPPAARSEAAAPRPTSVVARGDLSAAAPLIARAKEAGVSIAEATGPAGLIVDGHVVAMSDGRPAAIRHVEDAARPAVLFDYVRDFAKTRRLALATAPQAGLAALRAAAGFFQALGIEATMVGDSPGLVVLRTLAMTANEGFAAVEAGVCEPPDLDLAMEKGTNWPEGPLAWAARVGLPVVLEAMVHLGEATGSDRYRPAPLLRRCALGGLGIKDALVRFA
jgi:3-hydroxybutyryl-CoA dehydrogenase